MRHIVNQALNAFFPPQCLVCETSVVTHGTLCLSCWEKIKFIAPPVCACCGLPLPYAPEEGMLCGACLEAHPPYSAAVSVLSFDENSKALIHKLKFQDETYLAKIFASWLARAGEALISRCELIVPVPLHKKRLISRRYNQSALLAEKLGKQVNLPVISDALLKIKNTPPQSGMSKKERENNVKNAFVANKRRIRAISGRSVLLVDDVMTTGTTAQACTLELLKAGAASVSLLTLARVSRD